MKSWNNMIYMRNSLELLDGSHWKFPLPLLYSRFVVSTITACPGLSPGFGGGTTSLHGHGVLAGYQRTRLWPNNSKKCWGCLISELLQMTTFDKCILPVHVLRNRILFMKFCDQQLCSVFVCLSKRWFHKSCLRWEIFVNYLLIWAWILTNAWWV